jgi:nucleoside-diphosphate-sugar epimerase
MSNIYNNTLKNFYRGKRILITGGAGFIGSRLAKELVGLGGRVWVLEKPEADLWRLREIARKIKITRIQPPVLSELQKSLTKERPEIIFNLAARVDARQSIETLPDLMGENFLNTVNLLQAAAEIKPEKFIHFGTIEEYGSQNSPFVEIFRESPISPYSLTKTMATHLALLFNKLLGLNVCVVRPAAVFGPGQGLGMLIPNLILSCLNKKDFDLNPGNQLRDFIYVDDLVRGVLAAGAEKRSTGEIINLGSGGFNRVKDIVNKINELMGSPIKIHFGAQPYRPLDTMKFYLDSRKAKKLLGWQATTKIKEALKKTIAWYKENEAKK